MSNAFVAATDSVESSLSQFSTAFTVRDLMTPREALIGADTIHEARIEHKRHGFDVIPHPSIGTITGYCYRGGDLTPLSPTDLVSCDTSLLDLLSLFAEREFFFALHGIQISGYVHFSDLNKPLMRTPFYMLMEATERHLLSTLRQSITEAQATSKLTRDRIGQLNGHRRKAAARRADTDLWDVLGLPDVLSVAMAHGLARVSDTESLVQAQADELVYFRNSIAHSGLPLVEDHYAVERLINLRKLCSQLRTLNGPPSEAPPVA